LSHRRTTTSRDRNAAGRCPLPYGNNRRTTASSRALTRSAPLPFTAAIRLATTATGQHAHGQLHLDRPCRVHNHHNIQPLQPTILGHLTVTWCDLIGLDATAMPSALLVSNSLSQTGVDTLRRVGFWFFSGAQVE
jgi:hypothetical protein